MQRKSPVNTCAFNNKTDLFQNLINIVHTNYTLKNSNIFVFNQNNILKKYILKYKNLYYWVNLQEKDSTLAVNKQFNYHLLFISNSIKPSS